jgi:hypothetical protein
VQFRLLPVKSCAKRQEVAKRPVRFRLVRVKNLTTRIAMWLLPVLVLAQVFPTALHLCSPCRAAEVSKRDNADSAVVFTTNVNRSNPSGAYCPCKRKSVAASLKSPFVEACESISDALPQPLLLARTVAGQLPLARPGVDENVIALSGSPAEQCALICRFDL